MNVDLLSIVPVPHTILMVDLYGSSFLTYTTKRPEYKELDYLQAVCDAIGLTLLDVIVFLDSTVRVTVTAIPDECDHKDGVHTLWHYLCNKCGRWICILCQDSHSCDGEYLDAGGSL